MNAIKLCLKTIVFITALHNRCHRSKMFPTARALGSGGAGGGGMSPTFDGAHVGSMKIWKSLTPAGPVIVTLPLAVLTEDTGGERREKLVTADWARV